MTWRRRHCIECWHDMEHCATCGCHDTDNEPDDCANLALNSTVRGKGAGV